MAESRKRCDGATRSQASAHILAWGWAQRSAEGLGELRRTLPSWSPPDTPHHFFKYADEQTLLAVHAVDDALRRSDLDPVELRSWGMIGAPRFLGRQVTAHAVEQYARLGGTRVSPHIIPQNSLHSISGALSILLASRGPNVGVGGGHTSLTDGLFAALTLFDHQSLPGCWLIATAWDPEPLPNRQGTAASPGVCHAVALAVSGQSQGQVCGELDCTTTLQVFSPDAQASPTVADLVAAFQEIDRAGEGRSFAWRLPWGSSLSLHVVPQAVRARAAA